MTNVKLMVLYPYPNDTAQFDSDYREHLKLLHQKTNIPEGVVPYTVTRILPTSDGNAPFYQIFTMPFPSMDALQQARITPEMQEVAADAIRISSGGRPIILVGAETD